jgi:hypothetical protein
MRSRLLASVDVIEFQTTEAYSNLELTNVKYSTYINNPGKKIRRLWSGQGLIVLCSHEILNQHDYENIILNQRKNNDNNQFLITCVPTQQPKGQ